MKKINAYQRELYASFASSGSQEHVNRYLYYLKEFENRENIKILDIGGATGDFVYLLKKYFGTKKVEAYVVDSTIYDTWTSIPEGGDNLRM